MARNLVGLLIVIPIMVAGCASSPPDPKIPATFSVDVGYEDLGKGVEAEAFFPPSLSLNVGDTVVFTSRSREPHTVTFNAPSPVPDLLLPQPDGSVQTNPIVILPSPSSGTVDLGAGVDRTAALEGTTLISSGIMRAPGDRFTVHAAVPGTWQVVCLLHSSTMKGTLIVNPRGTARPLAEADYRMAAAAQLKAAQERAAALAAAVHVPDPATAAGHKTWTVYAGAGSAEDGIQVMKFFGGESLSIKVGDSVTFDMTKNEKGTLHTVTFLSGAAAPDLLILPPGPGGQPALLVNPKVLQPAPPASPAPAAYDGSAFASSGLMITGLSAPQSWTVTFTKPGSFAYRCLVHAGKGMKGTIVVQP